MFGSDLHGLVVEVETLLYGGEYLRSDLTVLYTSQLSKHVCEYLLMYSERGVELFVDQFL